jgi:DNA adenine methylase
VIWSTSGPRDRRSGGPIFKWAGGKRRLAPEILPLLHLTPATRYVEPFVGGGAIFFAMRAAGFTGPAWINDLSPHVAATYAAVQVAPDLVIAAYRRHVARDSRSYYFGIRKHPPADLIEHAGWFLYLNRAGFNGLWRENRRGECNVPYGDGKPILVDEDAIRAASATLVGVQITWGDFVSRCPNTCLCSICKIGVCCETHL